MILLLIVPILYKLQIYQKGNLPINIYIYICKYTDIYIQILFNIKILKNKHRRYELNITPNAENLLVLLGGGSGPRKTSDLGRGGRRGRKITLASSRISSSRSLESLETESCRCTLSWSPTPVHSMTSNFVLKTFFKITAIGIHVES